MEGLAGTADWGGGSPSAPPHLQFAAHRPGDLQSCPSSAVHGTGCDQLGFGSEPTLPACPCPRVCPCHPSDLPAKHGQHPGGARAPSLPRSLHRAPSQPCAAPHRGRDQGRASTAHSETSSPEMAPASLGFTGHNPAQDRGWMGGACWPNGPACPPPEGATHSGTGSAREALGSPRSP